MGDPEIEAISAVASALADLEDDARGRVLRWAAERYDVRVPQRGRGGADAGGAGDEEDVTEEEISAEAPTFNHFAELFNATSPTSNEDKALVAGYWFQAIKGQDKLKATNLQNELKNMGHAIPNITDALMSNIRKKPARILQVAKSGSTRQARKTYKLTHEGLVYVQGMIGHGG
jgi:hypothetical protein